METEKQERHTELVYDADLMKYRKAQLRAGRFVVQSAPTLGGYYVTTRDAR